MNKKLNISTWGGGVSPLEGTSKGRSVLEMLSILLIVAILSVVAIAGIRYAMDKNTANQIVKEAFSQGVYLSNRSLPYGEVFKNYETDLNFETKRFCTSGCVKVDVINVSKSVCSKIMNNVSTADSILISVAVGDEGATACQDGDNKMVFTFLGKPCKGDPNPPYIPPVNPDPDPDPNPNPDPDPCPNEPSSCSACQELSYVNNCLACVDKCVGLCEACENGVCVDKTTTKTTGTCCDGAAVECCPLNGNSCTCVKDSSCCPAVGACSACETLGVDANGCPKCISNCVGTCSACENGVCVDKTTTKATGTCCDGASVSCCPLNENCSCTPAESCTPCAITADCGACQRCNPDSGTCEVREGNSATCEAGYTQVGTDAYGCAICEKECTANTDCSTGSCCKNGKCTTEGCECTTAADCCSENPCSKCVDGYCVIEGNIYHENGVLKCCPEETKKTWYAVDCHADCDDSRPKVTLCEVEYARGNLCCATTMPDVGISSCFSNVCMPELPQIFKGSWACCANFGCPIFGSPSGYWCCPEGEGVYKAYYDGVSSPGCCELEIADISIIHGKESNFKCCNKYNPETGSVDSNKSKNTRHAESYYNGSSVQCCNGRVFNPSKGYYGCCVGQPGTIYKSSVDTENNGFFKGCCSKMYSGMGNDEDVEIKSLIYGAPAGNELEACCAKSNKGYWYKYRATDVGSPSCCAGEPYKSSSAMWSCCKTTDGLPYASINSDNGLYACCKAPDGFDGTTLAYSYQRDADYAQCCYGEVYISSNAADGKESFGCCSKYNYYSPTGGTTEYAKLTLVYGRPAGNTTEACCPVGQDSYWSYNNSSTGYPACCNGTVYKMGMYNGEMRYGCCDTTLSDIINAEYSTNGIQACCTKKPEGYTGPLMAYVSSSTSDSYAQCCYGTPYTYSVNTSTNVYNYSCCGSSYAGDMGPSGSFTLATLRRVKTVSGRDDIEGCCFPNFPAYWNGSSSYGSIYATCCTSDTADPNAVTGVTYQSRSDQPGYACCLSPYYDYMSGPMDNTMRNREPKGPVTIEGVAYKQCCRTDGYYYTVPTLNSTDESATMQAGTYANCERCPYGQLYNSSTDGCESCSGTEANANWYYGPGRSCCKKVTHRNSWGSGCGHSSSGSDSTTRWLCCQAGYHHDSVSYSDSYYSDYYGQTCSYGATVHQCCPNGDSLRRCGNGMIVCGSCQRCATLTDREGNEYQACCENGGYPTQNAAGGYTCSG